MTTCNSAIPDIYVEILADFCTEYPEHTMRLSKYLSSLAKLCKTRGMTRYLCVELPSQGKIYDKGLSSGVWDGRLPGYLEPLLSLTFYKASEAKWNLRADVDPRVIFYTRTLLYGCKKLKLQAPLEVRMKGLLDFFNVEEDVLDEDYDFGRNSVRNLRSSCRDDILDMVIAKFVPLKYPEWEDLHPKHGPGAVADLSFRREDKFAFPTWDDDLEEWFPYNEFAYYHYNGSLRRPNGTVSARVCDVPKTLDKVRVITVEPSSKQFCQQALRGWLIMHQTAVAKRSINFHSQEESRVAAKRASEDGLTATVDLKSASDYLSVALVNRVFSINQPLLGMFHATRSKSVEHPDGDSVNLKKYAGQGNATTFVIQSLVYSILAVTAVLCDMAIDGHTIRPKNVIKASRRVRVFGDDILLPSQNMATFSALLADFGLRVNHGKTHHTGFFREACGGDYFRGHDVTPFYIRDFVRRKNADGLVSWCAVSNNAYLKGLWRVCKHMREGLNLPVNSTSGFGFISHLHYRYSPKERRWNADLQRFEYREKIPVTRSKQRDSELTHGRLYKYFVEQPTPEVEWDGRLTVRSKVGFVSTWVA